MIFIAMKVIILLKIIICAVVVTCFKHKVALPVKRKCEPPSKASVQAILDILNSKVLGAHTKEVEKMFPDSWNNLNFLAEKVEDKAKEMDSEVALASWFYAAVDEAAGRRKTVSTHLDLLSFKN